MKVKCPVCGGDSGSPCDFCNDTGEVETEEFTPVKKEDEKKEEDKGGKGDKK
jgi:hypothetical protein